MLRVSFSPVGGCVPSRGVDANGVRSWWFLLAATPSGAAFPKLVAVRPIARGLASGALGCSSLAGVPGRLERDWMDICLAAQGCCLQAWPSAVCTSQLRFLILCRASCLRVRWLAWLWAVCLRCCVLWGTFFRHLGASP